MKNPSLLTTVAAAIGLLVGSVQAQIAPSGPTNPQAEEEPVELSPFTVSAESDVGWLATASLAGSRLNTPLRDTGASINVLTSEFLADIGALNLEDAVGYAVNIHMNTNEGTNVNDSACWTESSPCG